MDANPASDKIAIIWLDVLLVLILVICGAALWSAAKRYTSWTHQSDTPLKETFEQALNVPLRSAELTAIEKNLEHVQAKLLEEQMETLVLTAQVDAETNNLTGKITPEQQSKWSEVLLEHRTKLTAASAMIGALRSDCVQSTQQMIQAKARLIEAQHAANIAYLKSLQRFEFRNRIRTITLGSAAWLMLLIVAWFACAAARKSLGKGSRRFVLTTLFFFLAAFSAYELLR